tara:strand:+ start:655 stop:1128 length:474 start_codon:yes stop_codon:yes gene_type:complete
MYKLSLNYEFSDKFIESLGLSIEIFKDIENIECTGFLRMPDIKKALTKIFSDHGFILRQKLHRKHNIYITGIKEKIGLCIQMGHKAGWYYDMTKLTYLKNTGLIDKAIIVLPSKELQTFCKTSNIATYELVSSRLELFEDIFNNESHIMRLDISRRI